MKPRDLAALALLPAATLLERTAYFGAHASLSFDLYRESSSAAVLGRLHLTLQGLVLLGLLLGAVAALRLGPRVTAALGAALAAAGHVALAMGAPILIGAGVAGVGAGMLRPCPVVIAAGILAWDGDSPEPPPPYRFSAVAAFATVASLAANLGGAFGASSAGILHEPHGLAYRVYAALALLAAGLTGAVAVLGRRGRGAGGAEAPAAGPYREALAPRVDDAGPSVKELARLAILGAPQAVYWAGEALMKPRPGLGVSAGSLQWLHAAATAGTGLASLGLFVALVVESLRRSSRPPLVIPGAGLVILAFGVLTIPLAGSSSAVGFAAGAFVAGTGQAAAIVLLAYAALAVRGRAATSVVAGWIAAGSVLGAVGGTVAAWDAARVPLSSLCSVLALAGGTALLVRGRALHRAYFDA
jgi:hypothetical protein